MCTRLLLILSVIVVFGCDKPDAESAVVAAKEMPITKEAVEKQMAASDDGPDCATFVKEVKAACNDHYSKGLDVNCHTRVMQVNTALKQTKGELFAADDQDVAAKAGMKMCAMMGKTLRERVAQAKSTPVGPKCQNLGQKLDKYCFSKIGTKDYPQGCNGIMIATTKFTDQAETMCEMQEGIAGASIFK